MSADPPPRHPHTGSFGAPPTLHDEAQPEHAPYRLEPLRPTFMPVTRRSDGPPRPRPMLYLSLLIVAAIVAGVLHAVLRF